ncbi:MAG: hypothetical protein K940chlam7_01126 [Chlamydiae bacterium]|nr:hypothetical protein [Chlamydiota bacterium]
MWHHYKKSTPKKVKGGIKAQSKKGEFAQKWWAKRWISALETFHDTARLGRGRTYARRGQVLSIDIRTGKVEAKVQGSRARPYRVVIETDTLSEIGWRQVIELLSTRVVYAAKLMSGEMPEDIEEIFEQSNLSLLPRSHEELHTDCSCPDWSNPCKHVAAVFYLLGEEFDRDPFLIFKLRGMDRGTFIDLLEKGSETSFNVPIEKKTDASEPLGTDFQKFWHGKTLPESFHVGDPVPPNKSASLLQSLGKFPFWRGKEDLAATLSPSYAKAAFRAQEFSIDN